MRILISGTIVLILSGCALTDEDRRALADAFSTVGEQMEGVADTYRSNSEVRCRTDQSGVTHCPR